jgi:hypothetical protein
MLLAVLLLLLLLPTMLRVWLAALLLAGSRMTLLELPCTLAAAPLLLLLLLPLPPLLLTECL